MRTLTVHGCAYGVVDSHGQPLKKPKSIATTHPTEFSKLQRFCPGGHVHAQNRGRECKNTELYSPEMVDMFHRLFARWCSRKDNGVACVVVPAQVRSTLANFPLSSRSEKGAAANLLGSRGCCNQMADLALRNYEGLYAEAATALQGLPLWPWGHAPFHRLWKKNQIELVKREAY